MPLQAYAKFLGSHGLPVTAIVTEMRFDTASATPRLTFKAVRPLEADELQMSQEKGKSTEAKAAIASTVAMVDGVKTSKPKDRELGDNRNGVTLDQLKKAAEVAPTAAEEEPTKRAKKAAPKDVADILDDWAE
jgi:hypothetical protein